LRVELLPRERTRYALADQAAVGGDEERLRKALDAVGAGRRIRLVAHHRVGQLVAADEAPRVAGEVLSVDADEDHAAIAPPLPARLEERRLVFAGRAPRRPEVQNDHVTPQGGELQLPGTVE